jgi:endonuclease/exonuclease/phosphatase family metal-dependent hydrolase
MIRKVIRKLLLALALACQLHSNPAGAAVLRLATFNVENFLDTPTATRRAKSPAAQAKVVESILALKPDVIALEEIGSTNALAELQASLKTNGLNLPYWHEVGAADADIHVAVLSRFPLTVLRAHTNESFLLDGKRVPMKRGFTELSVAVVVLGDFNDLIDSKPMRMLLGRGRMALFDTRPAERNTSNDPARQVVWTDYYAKEDLYGRIDYILVSRAMKAFWQKDETYVLNLPDWGLASDHRPLVAGFNVPDQILQP